MQNISSLADQFATLERPTGVMLDDETVQANLIAATRFHAGWASLKHQDDAEAITGDTHLSHSEWALIRPLFMLYIERETALQLEASRGLGLDVFGRSTSEIAGEITQAEMEHPRKAFCMRAFSV
jgi:hypothetical protein